MYLNRHLAQQVSKASAQYPVVLVCGARKTGKATMLRHLDGSSRGYVSLENIRMRRIAEQDPALFFAMYPPPLLIDAFQRVPSLLLEMKYIVDQMAMDGKDNRGMYWLAGTQQFSMMEDVPDSLAGRMAVYTMSSLSSAELEGRSPSLFHPDLASLGERVKTYRPKTMLQLYQDILRGGMPEVCAADETLDRGQFFADYVTTYVTRDVLGQNRVRQAERFYDFLVYLASQTGCALRYEEAAGVLGISAHTAKEWVNILVRSGIVYVLRPYFTNVSKRFVKAPKVYFLDTGLAAHLVGWETPKSLMLGPMSGAFLETYVVSEIVKSYLNAGKRPNLYYYRDTDQKEVDLLIIEGNQLYPIEIKQNKDPAHADKNFGVLANLSMEVQPGIVICLADDFVPYNRTTWLYPAWAI